MGIAAGAALLAAATAAAEEPARMSWPSASADAPTVEATSSCSCRYPGGSAELGETICMGASGDRYLARCEMVLNNTAWKRVREGCGTEDAVSSLGLAERLAKLLEPAVDPGLVHAQVAFAVH